MFTDTHCHLLKEYYNNIEEIINEAKANEVNRFITSGYDYNSNEETINLASQYNEIYGTIGIHPQAVNEYNEEWLNQIKNNATKLNIVAIGEIGLDYHYEKSNQLEQIELFEKQLEIAQQLKLPVVIHSRDATEDTINCLKKYNVKGVIHSFGGSLETANIYIKMGFFLGINGTVTFKNSNLKNVIKNLSLKNIILETDSPYLTPDPNRGEKNSPKYIIDIAKYICLIKNISIQELSLETENNLKRIFDI